MKKTLEVSQAWFWWLQTPATGVTVALVALAMYWPCRWFARIRRGSSAVWIRYF